MEARAVIRADGLFEGMLGLALVVGAATGGLGSADFPSPVGTAVIAVVGGLLLALAFVLWRGGVSISALALGNTVAVAAAVAWLLAASGFSTTGAALVASAVGGLLVLALVQAAIVLGSDRYAATA
jgi:hypothetical protein